MPEILIEANIYHICVSLEIARNVCKCIETKELIPCSNKRRLLLSFFGQSSAKNVCINVSAAFSFL